VESLSRKWPQAALKLVEDKANGPAVVDALKEKIEGLTAINPLGSKEARASAASAQVEAGNVYLPEPSIAPWVHDFLEEVSTFPKAAFDDQVDAMTQALLRLAQRQSRRVMPPIILGASRAR
jgi:predicted phage terminase large subunit-like protein